MKLAEEPTGSSTTPEYENYSAVGGITPRVQRYSTIMLNFSAEATKVEESASSRHESGTSGIAD